MSLKKRFINFLFIFAFVLLITACVPTSKVTSIEIDEITVPSEIIIDDDFDITSLYIFVEKSDGTKVRIQVTENMIEPFQLEKFSTLGEHNIELSFSGQKCIFSINVVSLPTEEVLIKINQDIDEITIPSEIIDTFQLPTTGSNGSVITWTSDDPAITIDANGLATAHHPIVTDGDVEVLLVATLSLNEITLTSDYNVLVTAISQEDYYQAQMDSVASSIVVPTLITDSLSLPFTSELVEGVTISWTSSNPDIIEIDNDMQTVTVHQPTIDSEVNLTFQLTYLTQTYDYPEKVITVARLIVTTPSVTNLALNNNILSWDVVNGADSYQIYLGDDLLGTVSTNQIELTDYLPTNPGFYFFGVQTVAFGIYNENSEVVTIEYQVENEYVGTYYDSIDFSLVDNALKLELRDLLVGTHTHYCSYDDLRQDLQYTDADIDHPGNIILFYLGTSVDGTWDSGITWNREHVWPRSLGWFEYSGAGSDIHHLRPTNPSVNSSRGNKLFNDVLTSQYYAPRDSVKGDIARIFFYMFTRYSESDSYSFTDIAYSKELLLRWNDLDPVDSFEMMRNNRSAEIQGNRNPFIDYPDLADQIWE